MAALKAEVAGGWGLRDWGDAEGWRGLANVAQTELKSVGFWRLVHLVGKGLQVLGKAINTPFDYLITDHSLASGLGRTCVVFQKYLYTPTPKNANNFIG